jgi:hypothetical protein
MKTWIIAAAVGIALVAAGGSGAFAQAGSTGGTLGNTDKSISGDREEPQQGDRHQSRPREIERSVKSAPSAVSVAGRWHWTADCDNGHYEAEFVLLDVNNGRFTGNFTGGAGDGTITDGSINGKSIAFTRHFMVFTQRWVGQVSGGHVHGSLSGASSCTWEASKL